ncbi:hypothetical protein D6C79_08351 [Aureobasidium pullulans]|nr:hypothetical protein D6C79_08351 [Aureobasidium pullulans]
MFMSSPRSLRTRAGVLALLLQSTQTSAQSGLLSCANVDCPILDNTAISNCSVAGASYSVIGLTSIQSLSGSNLEWTIAVNQSKTGNDSLINRTFYLGVESSNFFESQGQSACSFFFTTLDDGPLFYDPMTSVSTDCTSRDGTGFSSQCISDLKSKANDLATSDTSICNSIAQTLQDDPPSSCSLASVWTASIYTSIENDTTIRSGAGTTPVMTVFFAEGNNEKSSAELVCLRPVDLNEKSVETMDDGTSEAQGMHVVSYWLVVLGLTFSATCVLL